MQLPQQQPQQVPTAAQATPAAPATRMHAHLPPCRPAACYSQSSVRQQLALPHRLASICSTALSMLVMLRQTIEGATGGAGQSNAHCGMYTIPQVCPNTRRRRSSSGPCHTWVVHRYHPSLSGTEHLLLVREETWHQGRSHSLAACHLNTHHWQLERTC